MNLLNALKYIVNAISYGVIIAVVVIVLFPDIKNGQSSGWNLFSQAPSEPARISYSSAVKRAGPAVVNIYSQSIQSSPFYYRSQSIQQRLGSGVIMSSNGYMLTNYHVIQNATQIVVQLQTGQTFPANVIGFDMTTDLAVLKIEAENLPVIPQDTQYQSEVGDVVLAIGNPFALGQTITQGIISATGRPSGFQNHSYLQLIQMDAAINNGNSGGALIDSNGVLIGITSHQYQHRDQQQNVQGIFFAVPYHIAYKVMVQIIENGRVVRGWIGVTDAGYSPLQKGVSISELVPNGPAAKAGLTSGDVIYQIGDMPIESIHHALDIVTDTRPGTEVIFKVLRNNQSIEIPVIIGEYRPRNR